MPQPQYMLDTNICIYVLNNRPPHIATKFLSFQKGDLAISSITVAELAFGAAKSQRTGTKERIELFLLELIILPFDENAAWIYGDLRAQLQKSGTPIGPLDLQIAAHALSNGLALVTNNEKEFQRVPELRVENWIEG